MAQDTAVYSESSQAQSTERGQRRERPDRWGRHGQRRETERRGPWGEQRKHLEQFRMLKLLELLDLNEDQEVEFITAFSDMRRELRELQQQRRELVDNLGDSLRERTITDDGIIDLVQRISDLGDRERQVMEEFLAESQKVLTPQQLGKLIVFQERFERELLEQVRAFRERRHGPSGLEDPSGPPSLVPERDDSL